MRSRTILAALLAATVSPALFAAEPPAQPDYYAVMLDDQKLGHMVFERTASGDRVVSKETFFVALRRGDAVVEIAQNDRTTETADGRLLEFEVTAQMSGRESRTRGVLRADGMLALTEEIGGQKTERTMAYPPGALMSEGIRLLQKKHGLKPGTAYESLHFSATDLKARRVVTEIGEKERIDLLGRVVEATKVTDRTELGPNAVVTAVGYADDEGTMLRGGIDLLGRKFTFIKCDRTFALSKAVATTDFLADFLVKSPSLIPPAAPEVIYVLKPREQGRKIAIPATDSQKVSENPDGTVTVTVLRLTLPAGQALPYAGSDEAALEALKPGRFVQSDDPLIAKKALEIVGESKDAAEAAEKLARWVNAGITTQDLSVGYASASEVMRSRQGDCTEFAVLLAAMCRAAGIPSRLASGMLYVPAVRGRTKVFGGHQWAQVYVGGKWIDLDATLPAPHRDARRITLAVGEAFENDWFAILGTFNQFDIADVKVNK